MGHFELGRDSQADQASRRTMYQPAAFREDRIEVQHELIGEQPLGLIVSNGTSGLVANLVPFVLYPGEGEKGTLRTHLAHANPQWQDLQEASECLVVFQGAQDYITPSWLPSKQVTEKVVPTWNYVTVHVWGKPRVIEEAAWLLRQITDLTHAQEKSRPEPWKVADAPPDFVAAQMRAIVGIEIPIDRIEGKWKVSQNRTEADRRGIFAGLHSQGGSSGIMADLVAKRGTVEK
jgi:transcriptional regulator